jgi:hypothetical protein
MLFLENLISLLAWLAAPLLSPEMRWLVLFMEVGCTANQFNTPSEVPGHRKPGQCLTHTSLSVATTRVGGHDCLCQVNVAVNQDTTTYRQSLQAFLRWTPPSRNNYKEGNPSTSCVPRSLAYHFSQRQAKLPTTSPPPPPPG